LHDEVLRRVLAQPEPEPATVAFHARAAHQPQVAYRAQCSAARHAAALGAHRQAAEHYRQAVADADRFDEPAEISELWMALSVEEYLNGADAAALDAAQRVLEFYPAGADPLRRGAAISWLSRMTNAEDEAIRLAFIAIEILEPLGPSPTLAGAYANIANQLMRARDLAPAISWARRTIELARQIEHPESLAAGLDALGCSLMLRGRDPSGAYLREAIEVARVAGLPNELGRAYANLVSAAGEARLYRVSMAAIPEALAYFVAQDMDGHATYLRAWQARCRFEQGEWVAADSVVRDILEAPSEPSAISAVAAWCVRGRIRIRRGEGGGWAALDRAKQIADPTGALQRLAPVVAARAEARWLDGIRDDGADGLISTYELALVRTDHWAAGELGFWMWRHGHLTELPDWVAEPYRRHVAGDLVAAAKLWRELGCRYEQADALRDSGDEQSVRAALELYDSLGAQPGRRRAVARLRDLGVRTIPRGPRASTAAHADGLTAREVEVLQWLRAGHTDAEIGAGLHLSTKTVGHHVSAVLRKMGATSRRELLARD
jgi:DNA-binding CsgD family transcriptional regulator/tetratricopeptide (TPR) repeat protein